MLRIAVITLFPEMLGAVTNVGMTQRAMAQTSLEVLCFNPRDYVADAYKRVDDRPYGGGPGMVMMVAPLRAAITSARQQTEAAKVVYLSPQGKPLQQQLCEKMAATKQDLILIAGRYEGIDERLVQLEVDEEWSLGDYVLSGGELPAMVLIDAIARCLPGVLGHAESAAQDSFSAGLLDCPHYTRPEQIAGLEIPAVLKSGDHQAIRRWRLKQSLGRTWQRRPELLQGKRLDEEQQLLLDEYKSDDETDY